MDPGRFEAVFESVERVVERVVERAQKARYLRYLRVWCPNKKFIVTQCALPLGARTARAQNLK